MSNSHPRLHQQPFPSSPNAAANRARFFICWLRRNAPDTHLDQAKGNTAGAFRPGGYAAPEELWRRNASMGFAQLRGLPGCRRQSTAGSHSGRSAFTAYRGRRHGIPFNLGGCSPVNNQGLPVAVETLMRSSASYRMVCAPSAYGSMRGRACAPRPCAPGWYWSCLSFARRNVWPRRNSAAQNWPPR